MMKLMFLGAGASAYAGYPTAGQLLTALEAEAAKADVMTRAAWESFKAFRSSLDGTFLREVLKSDNLELTITVLDLLAARMKEAHENWQRDVSRIFQGQESATGEEIDFSSHTWEELTKWERVRLDFVLSLANLFEVYHYRDSKADKHARDYIRGLLCRLEAGDVVITTNWDTVAERTLLEEKKWRPSDGYGFDVSLDATVKGGRIDKVPEQANAPSPVKILKLHGSIGWFRRHDGKLYVRHTDFLEHFAPAYACVRDRLEPDDCGQNDDSVLISPSYMKELTESALQQVWDQAQRAVLSADIVTVLGYSLPDADTPVRVLLNPLRSRLHDHEARAIVVDDSYASLHRWRDFLGQEVTCIRSRIEDWRGQC